MFWLLVPLISLVGKVIYHVVTEEDVHTPQKKTILELNLGRLRQQLHVHTGRKIAILGQPGAGKSTLLKKITNDEVIPKTVIGAQTDATNWSDDEKCNLLSHYKSHAFVDVPGYDTSSHPANIFASSFPFDKFDIFVFVICGKLRAADETIFRLIANTGKAVCIARSYSDGLEADEIGTAEKDIKTRLEFHGLNPVIFFSNRTGSGIYSITKFVC